MEHSVAAIKRLSGLADSDKFAISQFCKEALIETQKRAKVITDICELRTELISTNLRCVEFKTTEEADSFMKAGINAAIPEGATVRQIGDARDCVDPRFVLLTHNEWGK